MADISQKNLLVAARGLSLTVGQTLALPAAEREFMKRSLLSNRRVAVLSEHGVLIVFSDLLPVTGLLPVLLPNGSNALLAHSLRLLNEHTPVCMSPALDRQVDRGGDLVESCAMLMEQLTACDSIFRPQENTDFRLHCAQIAGFAGCRVNVTELPVGALPIIDTDRIRWTAFLLCTFLALRGDSAAGPNLQLENSAGSFQLRLHHTPERFRTEPLTGQRFAYLKLPCFYGMTLTKTDGGLLLEVTLRRKEQAGYLHAFSAPGNVIRLVLERVE